MFRTLALAGARRRALAFASLALTLTTATACGTDAATAPQDNLTGAFSLESVDGDAPPATVFNGKAKIDGQVVELRVEILSSEIDLDTDDAYFLAFMLRVTVNGKTATQSVSNEGTYKRSGTTIQFTSDDDDVSEFRGTWANRRLTLRLDIVGTGDEYDFAYSKGT